MFTSAFFVNPEIAGALGRIVGAVQGARADAAGQKQAQNKQECSSPR